MGRATLGRLGVGVALIALMAGQLPVGAQGGGPGAQSGAPPAGGVPAQGGVPAAPAPLPPVVSDDPWFGAVQAIFAPQAALNAGVKWQRLIFPWDQIQPNNGSQFEKGYFSDADVDGQRALGFELVGVTLYTPRWAARDPRFGGRSVPANLQLPIDDPRNHWAAYVKRLVGHFRGRIDTWVFYNEPDMYIEPDDYRTFAGTPEDYAQVLRVAYLAAKAANPDARVVMSGFTYSWDKQAGRPQYLQRVLDAIGGDPAAGRNNWYFDVVDAHTYGNPLNTYAVPTVFRRILREKGLDKPIWITESNVLPKDDPRVATGDGPFRATIDEQASYVIEAMALARAAGVQRYSIYKMQDEHPENEDEFWGLTRNDGSVRPSYLAYQTAVRYLGNVRGATYYWGGSQVPPSEQEISGLLASNVNRFQWPWPARVNVVVLDRGAERVTVVWNGSNQPAEYALPAQSRAALRVDKFGRSAPLQATNGYYPLSLEPSRNNSDPRDPTAYLVGGSPWIIVEDMTQAVAPAPTYTPTPGPSPTPHATFLPTPARR
jgi:hypothetical protein